MVSTFFEVFLTQHTEITKLSCQGSFTFLKCYIKPSTHFSCSEIEISALNIVWMLLGGASVVFIGLSADSGFELGRQLAVTVARTERAGRRWYLPNKGFRLVLFVDHIGKRADEGAKGSWAGSLWALLQELGELGAGNMCQSTSDKQTQSIEAMAVWFT